MYPGQDGKQVLLMVLSLCYFNYQKTLFTCFGSSSNKSMGDMKHKKSVPIGPFIIVAGGKDKEGEPKLSKGSKDSVEVVLT